MSNDEKIEELYQRIFELEEINNKLKDQLNKQISYNIYLMNDLTKAMKIINNEILQRSDKE